MPKRFKEDPIGPSSFTPIRPGPDQRRGRGGLESALAGVVEGRQKRDAEARKNAARMQQIGAQQAGQNARTAAQIEQMKLQEAGRNARHKETTARAVNRELRKIKDNELEDYREMTDGIAKMEGSLLSPWVSNYLDKNGKFPSSKQYTAKISQMLKDRGMGNASVERLLPIYVAASKKGVSLTNKKNNKGNQRAYIAARKDYALRNELTKEVKDKNGKNALVMDFSHPRFDLEQYTASMKALGFGEMASQDAQADPDFKTVMSAYDFIVGSGDLSDKQIVQNARRYSKENPDEWAIAADKIQVEFPQLAKKLEGEGFFSRALGIAGQLITGGGAKLAKDTFSPQKKTLINRQTGQVIESSDGVNWHDIKTGKRVQ